MKTKMTWEEHEELCKELFDKIDNKALEQLKYLLSFGGDHLRKHLRNYLKVQEVKTCDEQD